MRTDKFIWAVRLFKTRSLAAKACNNDKVLLNGETIKPSKLLKENDELSIKVIPIWKNYVVKSIPKSRVGPKLVEEYINEITSPEELEKLNQYEQMNKQNRNLGIKGRPTKRDRRDLGKWFS